MIANELKNNANKLAKWTTRAVLVGAEQMAGFVLVRTRAIPTRTSCSTRRRTKRRTLRNKSTSKKPTCGLSQAFPRHVPQVERRHLYLLKDPSKNILRFYKYEEKSSVF